MPDDLLQRLDQLARDLGVSRNRLIVEGCMAVVERHRDAWPADYLAGAHLDPEDLELLRVSAGSFAEELHAGRASRTEAPF